MSNGLLTLSGKAMHADKLAAVGLSIGLHGCVIALVAMTVGTRSGSLSVPTVAVSFDVPAIVEDHVSAMAPDLVGPARVEESRPALLPVPSTPATVLPPTLPESPAPQTQAMAPAPLEPVATTMTAPLQAPVTAPAIAETDVLSEAASVSPPLPPSPAIAPLQTVPEMPEAIAPQAPSPAATAAFGTEAKTAAVPEAAVADTRTDTSVTPAESPTTEVRPAEQPADPGLKAENEETPIQPVPSPGGLPVASVPATEPKMAELSAVTTLSAPSALTPVSPSEGVPMALAVPGPDAATTSAPPPADEVAAARLHTIRAFLARYDGGSCFVATAGRTSSSAAEIDSFASAPDKFTTLDHALKAATGVEAVVAGQRVWSTQCPVVDYLRRMPPPLAGGPVLEIDRQEIGGGDRLGGRIRGTADRHLGLYVISEAGAVEDVTRSLVAQDGAVAFAILPPRQGSTGGPFPQMLVAIAADRALPSHPASMTDLFDPLLAIGTDGLTVTAKLFLLTR